MCRLQNIAMCDQEKCDYQLIVTTGQTDGWQSDPYVPLCFAGDTKGIHVKFLDFPGGRFSLLLSSMGGFCKNTKLRHIFVI